MHQDDPRIIEKWNELTQIFSQDEKDTIAYLNIGDKVYLNTYNIGEIKLPLNETKGIPDLFGRINTTTIYPMEE